MVPIPRDRKCPSIAGLFASLNDHDIWLHIDARRGEKISNRKMFRLEAYLRMGTGVVKHAMCSLQPFLIGSLCRDLCGLFGKQFRNKCWFNATRSQAACKQV